MSSHEINYPFLVGLAAYLWFVNFIGLKAKLLVFFGAWLATGGHYLLYLAYHTLGRDFRLLKRGIPILVNLTKVKRRNMTVQKMFRKNLEHKADRVLFFNESEELTIRGVEMLSNRVAHMFLKMNYKKGDTVALFMENRIEYIPIWMGMAKVGVIPALINYNLRKDSLLHCVRTAGCKAILSSKDLLPAVEDIYEEFTSDNDFKIFLYDDGLKTDLPYIDVKKELKGCSSEPEPKHISDSIGCFDPLLYIYTSGTTGLPKAVNIKHMRQLFALEAAHIAIGLSDDDVIYCHLPLYHSSGGQVATGSAILHGTKTFIKKKFSARSFWKDCAKYEITATQYIGEICRYLLSTPPVPEEKTHKVNRMFGNGLRPQVWKEFVTRFNIKNISEFYGATEGNSNIVNNENKVGAVGFVGVIEPKWLQELLLPLMLIKVDPVTREPIRNQNGLCIRCEPGEPGEFVGKIVRGDPIKEFNGYKNKEETKKKVMSDVMVKGDLYFRSGDILVMDEFGWLYFKDRAGDTFRWKGENVSTAEVEVIVSKAFDQVGVVAYGVQIPGYEGRAGMVCLQTSFESIDLESGLEFINNQLPGYARPLFYRFSEDLDITGTYKLKKSKLMEEGLEVSIIKDKIMFFDTKHQKFEVLTASLYDSIKQMSVRL